METQTIKHKEFFFKLSSIKTIKKFQLFFRAAIVITGIAAIISFVTSGLDTKSLSLVLLCYIFINWINQSEIQIMRHKIEAWINEQSMKELK